MLSKSRTGAMAGLIAAVSMTATPAAAAQTGAAPSQIGGSAIYAGFDHGTYDSDTDVAHSHRWYRYGRHRHRVDAGDVLAGVLIIGGIAAIANAASKNDRRYRDNDYRRDRDYDRDYDRRDNDRRDYDRRSDAGSGLDNAVNMCVQRIERDVRVDTVDGVDRDGEGWRVNGTLFNGDNFNCRIDNNGRISDVDYGGSRGDTDDGDEGGGGYEPASTTGDDGQWNDARYIEARRSIGPQSPDTATSEQLPAYPGGPLPTEEYPEDADGNLGS